jgi:two-component sensor histidine kinase
MQQKFRNSFYVMGVWLIPVLFILFEATIFLSKANWKSDYVWYSVTFWLVRAALSPVIIFYTLKFWVDLKKWFRLFLVHLGGFTLFSILFWAGSYLILNKILHRSEFFGVDRTSTSMGVFGMIVDNSISTNTIVYVSTVVFCYVWEYFRQNVIINKRAVELEKSLLTSRLELLKGQLNTHFLFNTLHTISSLVVRKQNEEANKMLVRLSELLRFALKENKEQLIPLQRELELLQLYLEIQQMRYSERLQVNVTADASVQNSMVPSMLLQPLVENALKYAVEPYSDTGIIDIVIIAKNGNMNFSIRDNGKKDFKTIDFNNGVGLANTRERLQNLFPGQHKFSIMPNNGQGVRIDISIPNQSIDHAAIENSHS